MTTRSTLLAQHDGHQVGLYTDLADIGALVRDRLGDALGAGDGAILLFCRERRAAIATALDAAGFDLEDLRAVGRLVEADTDDVLDAILVDGAVVPDHVVDAVAPAWDLASGDEGRKVHFVTDIADMAWRGPGREAAEDLEMLADGFTGDRGGTLLCTFEADLLDVPDERTAGTLEAHGGSCITRARTELDRATSDAFDAMFDVETRRRLQAGEDDTGATGVTERLMFWVRRNRRGELEPFLGKARAVYEARRQAA